jgi:hypothetical protein
MNSAHFDGAHALALFMPSPSITWGSCGVARGLGQSPRTQTLVCRGSPVTSWGVVQSELNCFHSDELKYHG